MDSMNIRSPEERYGGEGHAGTDPFARPVAGQDRRVGADPALEVPDAGVADLTTMPNPDVVVRGGSTEGMSANSNGQTTSTEEVAGGFKQQAGEKAEVGIQKSAEGLKKAADMTRSVTEDRAGTVGTVGSQAADVLEKGANLLEKGDTEQIMQDLEALIRRRPMESLLVAAGAGFIVSKAMR